MLFKPDAQVAFAAYTLTHVRLARARVARACSPWESEPQAPARRANHREDAPSHFPFGIQLGNLKSQAPNLLRRCTLTPLTAALRIDRRKRLLVLHRHLHTGTFPVPSRRSARYAE